MGLFSLESAARYNVGMSRGLHLMATSSINKRHWLETSEGRTPLRTKLDDVVDDMQDLGWETNRKERRTILKLSGSPTPSILKITSPISNQSGSKRALFVTEFVDKNSPALSEDSFQSIEDSPTSTTPFTPARTLARTPPNQPLRRSERLNKKKKDEQGIVLKF